MPTLYAPIHAVALQAITAGTPATSAPARHFTDAPLTPEAMSVASIVHLQVAARRAAALRRAAVAQPLNCAPQP